VTLAAACTLGVAAGVAFGWLWLLVVPWAVHLRFWSAMTSLAGDILKVDDAAVFFGLYRNLLGATARYVGRNLAGTLVAGVPLVIVLLIASPSEIPFFVAFVVAMTAFFLWPSAKRS
jgi:hypothetical protein